MNVESFSAWLDAYGKAWMERDGEAFVGLFAPDACLHWTPFDEKRGRAEIAAAFIREISTREETRFGYSILAVGANAGIASWWSSFVRVPTGPTMRVEGVLRASFVWRGIHSRETGCR